MSFLDELRDLINCHSLDTRCDTADSILAVFLQECLQAYEHTMRKKRQDTQRDAVNESIKYRDRIIREAKGLLEPGEECLNVEYTRALLELTTRFLEIPYEIAAKELGLDYKRIYKTD